MTGGGDREPVPGGDAARRLAREIRERFAAWLDEVLADEPVPPRVAEAVWAALDGAPVDDGERAGRPAAGARAGPRSTAVPDLYHLFAALTALGQEVRLQGRAFQRLADRLERLLGSDLAVPAGTSAGAGSDGIRSPAPDGDPGRALERTLREVRRLADLSSREREGRLRDEGADQAFREVIDELLDMRDALIRGRWSCQVHLAEWDHDQAADRTPERPPAWPLVAALAATWQRLALRGESGLARRLRDLLAGGSSARDGGMDGDCRRGGERGPVGAASRRAGDRRAAVDALSTGLALSLDRLDELLQRREVRPLDCLGSAFDPHRMIAVDLEETEAVPDGQVLEVYLEGYERAGEVLRPARVKVARRRAPTGLKENPGRAQTAAFTTPEKRRS